MGTVQTRQLKALLVLCYESSLKLAHLQCSHFLTKEVAEADAQEKGGENQQPLRKHAVFLILICLKKVEGISTRFFSSFFTVNICVYARWSAHSSARKTQICNTSFFTSFFLSKAGLKSLLAASHQCVNNSCCRMETGSLLKIVYIQGIYIIHTSNVKCNHFYGITLSRKKAIWN